MRSWTRVSTLLRTVARRGAAAGAAVALAGALASCQGTGGSAAPPVPYEELRGNLGRAYAALQQAVAAGPIDQVPASCDAFSRELDRIEAATKRWGILEREKMKIQIATARRGVQAVARSAPVSGDVELLQAQLRPLGEAVAEVNVLLDQAAAQSKVSP